MITDATLDRFIADTRDILDEGHTLAQAEAFAPGGFTDDELRAIRERLSDRLGSDQCDWIDHRLEPPHIYDQIRGAAAVAAARRAEYESADAEMLRLCAAAVATGRSYTDVAAAAGTIRQVLTKRLERRACHTA